MSYRRCVDCGQEQQMPLTPVADLNHWNNNLVYIKKDFFKRMIKKEVGSQAAAKPKPTAAKSRSQNKVKSEVKEEEVTEEWHHPAWEEDVAMEELTYAPHTQMCDMCQKAEW